MRRADGGRRQDNVTGPSSVTGSLTPTRSGGSWREGRAGWVPLLTRRIEANGSKQRALTCSKDRPWECWPLGRRTRECRRPGGQVDRRDGSPQGRGGGSERRGSSFCFSRSGRTFLGAAGILMNPPFPHKKNLPSSMEPASHLTRLPQKRIRAEEILISLPESNPPSLPSNGKTGRSKPVYNQ